MSIPSSVRKSGGIVIIDIIDKWGWKNSATMDLSSFSFTGIPEMYDYGYKYREPFWSRRLPLILLSILGAIACFVAIFLLSRWYHGRV
jgi:hypothetical protein